MKKLIWWHLGNGGILAIVVAAIATLVVSLVWAACWLIPWRLRGDILGLGTILRYVEPGVIAAAVVLEAAWAINDLTKMRWLMTKYRYTVDEAFEACREPIEDYKQ